MTPEEHFCEIAVAARLMTEGQACKLLEDWVGGSLAGPVQRPMTDLVLERGLMTPKQLAQVLSLQGVQQAPDVDRQLLQVAVTRGLLTEAQAERAIRQQEGESRIQPKRLLSVLLEMGALTQAQVERLLWELSPGSPPVPSAAPPMVLPPPSVVPAPSAAPMAATMPMPQTRAALHDTRRRTPVRTPAPPGPPLPETRRRTPVAAPSRPAQPRDTQRSARDVGWKMLALEMRSLIGAAMILAVLALIAGVTLSHIQRDDKGVGRPPTASSGSPPTRPASGSSWPADTPTTPRGADSTAAPAPPMKPWDSSPLLAHIEAAQEAEAQGRYADAVVAYDTALTVDGVASESALCAALTREKARVSLAQSQTETAAAAESAGSLSAARPMYVEAFESAGTLQLVTAVGHFFQVPDTEMGPLQHRLLIKRYQALVRRGRTSRNDMRLVCALTCYEMAQRIVDASHCAPALPEPTAPRDAAADLAHVLAGKLDATSPPVASAHTDPSPPAPAAKPPTPQPGKEPPAAPPSEKGPDALDFIPGIEDVKDSDLQELRAASTVLFDLWRDRANLAMSIDEKKRGVKEADERIGKLPKTTTDKPAVLFVQGVSHFLLARGVFEEYLAKRSIAPTKEDKRRLVEEYEPLYNRELGTAATKLSWCRKNARKCYAAVLFEDLSRAWDLGGATATKGVADAKKDMDYFHPESAFDAEVQLWMQQGALPPPR